MRVSKNIRVIVVGLLFFLVICAVAGNVNSAKADTQYFTPFTKFTIGSYEIADQIVDIEGHTSSYGEGTGIILMPAKYIKKYMPKGSRVKFNMKKGYRISKLVLHYYKNGKARTKKLKNNSKLPVGWGNVDYLEVKVKYGKWKIYAGVCSEGGPTSRK